MAETWYSQFPTISMLLKVLRGNFSEMEHVETLFLCFNQRKNSFLKAVHLVPFMSSKFA